MGKRHQDKMSFLFNHADTDGSGAITFDEFQTVLELEEVQAWLGAMGLSVEDVYKAWSVMDDGDGMLTEDELAKGVSKLMGQARSSDLLTLVEDVKDLRV